MSLNEMVFPPVLNGGVRRAHYNVGAVRMQPQRKGFRAANVELELRVYVDISLNPIIKGTL